MGISLLLVLLIAIPVDEIPSKEILQIFDQEYFQVEIASGTKTYLYRLFRPLNRTEGVKYPLIVWLHGYGDVEFERIGFGHLKHTGAIFNSVDAAKNLDFYFLAVQCPIDQPGFFQKRQTSAAGTQIGVEPPEPGEIVVRLVDELISEEAIDSDRVTLVGISGAGAACLEMGMRYPDKYAGMAILGSPGCDLSRIRLLRATPIWAFHAAQDPDVPSNGVSQVVNAVTSSGGTAALTLIESNYHNCWAVAFRDYALLDWLISQQRNSMWARRPGNVPWTWTQWLVALGVVLIVVVICFGALRWHLLQTGASKTPSDT